jgi:hypothetical protein
MLLFYIMQRNTVMKFCIFQQSVTTHKCVTVLQVPVMLIPQQKFVRPPCWYFIMQKIENPFLF